MEHEHIDNQDEPVPPPTDAPGYIQPATPTTNGNGRTPRGVDSSRSLFSYDRDAEAALLGTMLFGADPAVIDDRAWTMPGAAAVHAAITRLHDGKPLDARLVASETGAELSDLQVDVDGIVLTGARALATLVSRAPSATAAPHFAEQVAHHARVRELAAHAGRVIDALRTGDTDTASQLLTERPAAAPASTLTVHWVHDTLEEPPPRNEDLVHGVLARGEITGVGANRNVGKSWFGMNLAMLLSHGSGRFLGELDVRQEARTLICHGEMNRAGAADRWLHLTGAYNPPASVGETFDQWRLRVVERRATKLHDGGTTSDRWYDVALAPTLERTIEQHSIDVLIVDPWRVYYAGNENSSDEVEAALDKLRQLAIDHNLAVVVFHHLRGGTEGDVTDPEDAWRGSTRLPDAVDNRVTLLPHYTRKQAREMGMTRKQARRYQDVYFLRRGGPAPEDIAVAWNPSTGWWERWRSPEEAGAELGGRPASTHYNPVDVVEVLERAGGMWPSLNVAARALGLSPSGAATLLDKTVRAGHIEEREGARQARVFAVHGYFDKDQEALDGML